MPPAAGSRPRLLRPRRGDDSDADADALAIAGPTAATGGTLAQVEVVTGSLRSAALRVVGSDATGTRVLYTPASGFSGTDSFTYLLSDGRGGTDTGRVTIAVGPGPQPPPGNFVRLSDCRAEPGPGPHRWRHQPRRGHR